MVEPDETRYSGRCRCGAYRFHANAEPFQVSWCHCSDCRRATGAPATIFAGFRENVVELLGNEAAVHQVTSDAARLFCSQCGTPIGYRDVRLPGEIYYYLGLLEESSRLVPQLHAFEAERLEWLNIVDDLPRFERFSRSR